MLQNKGNPFARRTKTDCVWKKKRWFKLVHSGNAGQQVETSYTVHHDFITHKVHKQQGPLALNNNKKSNIIASGWELQFNYIMTSSIERGVEKTTNTAKKKKTKSQWLGENESNLKEPREG